MFKNKIDKKELDSIPIAHKIVFIEKMYFSK